MSLGTTMLDSWLAWMAPMAWQALVWGTFAFLIDVAVGKRLWPQLRLGLWLLLGIRLLTPPTLSSPAGLVAAPTWTAATSTTSAPWLAPWLAPLFAIWCLGAALVLAGWVWRRRRTRQQLRLVAAPSDERLRAMARRAAQRFGGNKLPRLAWVPPSMGAAVFGLRDPIVLMPRGLSDAELEHALLHELGHIKRGDLWVQSAFAALCALYWFHPCVWLAAVRAHRARELSCDQAVAACLGKDAAAYRRSLLRAAGRRVTRPWAGVTSFAWRRSTILTRLDALERGRWRHRRVQRCGAFAGLVLTASILLPATERWTPPDAWQREMDWARAQFEAARRKEPGYGSMHARFALMKIRALEEQRVARRTDAR